MCLRGFIWFSRVLSGCYRGFRGRQEGDGNDERTTMKVLRGLSGKSATEVNLFDCVAHVNDDLHDCQASVGSNVFAWQTSSHACVLVRHSRYSFCSGSSLDLRDRLLPVGEPTGIRGAISRSRLSLSACLLSRARGS